MQLVYHGHFNTSGYSIAAQDYVLAMKKVKPELNLKFNFLNPNTQLGLSPSRQQTFNNLNKTKEELPQTVIYHSIPSRYRRFKGPEKFVGVALFETMTPPKLWIQTFNEMDLIITASQFNDRVFKENGLKVPTVVVPHAFDNTLFNKDVLAGGRYRHFTFMSIGTWKDRKNWEQLISAFYDAFSKNDNVCLVIKTDKPIDMERTVLRIKRTCEWRSKDTAPIYTCEKNFCHFEEIPQIMKKCDVYICPSLGEGFGLPGLHAMALGIPVITTKYGGVTEYAKPETCTFIEPTSYKTYPIMDGIPQFKNCIWPVLKTGQIRDAMIEVFKNYPTQKVMNAYNFVHYNFTYDQIGKKFLEALTL